MFSEIIKRAAGRSILVISAIIILIPVLGGSAFSQSMSFEDALKSASDQNKKVIVDVYTDWCHWCKKLDAEAYSDDGVKQVISDNFILVKLNAESSSMVTYNGKEMKCSDLAALFKVRGYPTTVFLQPDGSIIDFKYNSTSMNNVPGWLKTSDFKKLLEYMRDDKYKDTDLSSILS